MNEPTVNDIDVAFAAAHQVWTPASPSSTSVAAAAMDDDAEIDLDEPEPVAAPNVPPTVAADGSSDEESDDEDDIDLAKAVASMTNVEDEDDDPSPKTAPKTAHEVAPPPTPSLLPSQVAAITAAPLATLSTIGIISHHMVADRSLVVTSTHAPSITIDVGTVLCIATSGGELPAKIPLGTIAEVFGPVKKPLYMVELAKVTVEGGEDVD